MTVWEFQCTKNLKIHHSEQHVLSLCTQKNLYSKKRLVNIHSISAVIIRQPELIFICLHTDLMLTEISVTGKE